MKIFYFNLLLALLFSTTLNAQETIECGAPGTSVTVTDLEFSSLRRSGCVINYNITITATEVGAYSVEALGQPLVAFSVSDPGIVQFQGQVNTVFPCILLTRFLDEIDIVTPSGSCGLDVAALLPVKLLYFDAEEDKGKAVLNWGTETEVNNEGFMVEHTQTGEVWEPLGFVAGVGTTEEAQNYEFTVDGLPTGEHYFRLKQMDFDGQYEYSSIANLYIGEEPNTLRIFPNPLGRGQQLNIQGTFDQAELYNAAGVRVMQFQSPDALFSPQFRNLPAGFYHMVIQRNNETFKEKLVIQ
ncbi:T9SS type A sorting domain-containing protein [Flavilitoribacter nigricans]|uniref:T9SS type A sorting domain-containing protein n=1 Tax=Flavilitoribacter nigricans (strain ATCC 23147 / DSM 23189 / NBRC 102662 / NCIMB 1420 / SS-2) TaxID=1122177 RepID=A0A2D0N4E1_FLAN2|nr:T9SS type A sorting domain-containing protein [Flavilitoribacter nigricans]PHN03355.1 hypothetical protein CRP01_27100 [Flavilitoribacter nigricans DSM 23189 = NBRC 102662]